MAIPPLSDIDIRLLRVFRAVVECGGFGRAQIELGLARSTISTHMASLETRLGLKLCRRGRGGFALTERGRLVYDSTIRFFFALEGFRAEVGSLRDRIVGELNIGVVDNLIMDRGCHLNEAIASFTSMAPDVQLSVQVISPNQIEDWLSNGRLHLALLPEVTMPPTIKMKPLFVEHQRLYCGQSHAFFGRESAQITRKEIETQPYARRGYTTGTPYMSMFKNPASANAFHMEGIAHLILSGQYLGFLPKDYARFWVDQKQMRSIHPEWFNFQIPICIAYSTQTQLPMSAEVLRKTIIKIHENNTEN